MNGRVSTSNAARVAIAIALVAALAAPASTEAGKVSGYMFGDYYYVAAADDAAGTEKRNGTQFRRIYFTYDRDLDGDYSTRFRLEMKDAGYGKSAKMVPFVKNAYLKRTNSIAGGDLYLGLSGTPTWSVSEKVWGYRSIEKTIMDLNGIGSSADLGVSLKAKAGSLAYHVMLGNGPGQKPEQDNGKKLYGQVSTTAGGLQLVGYADYNMQPADQTQLTLAGFAGKKSDGFHGGVEGFMRVNASAGATGDDVTIIGVSVFGTKGLSDDLDAFARVDMVNNDDADTSDLLVIAGVDRLLAKDIHLMPNLYVELPDGPDPTIQARVTAYYKF